MLFLLFSCKSHPLKREERLKLYCLFVLTLRAWLWVYRAEGHTSILLVTISLFFQLQPSRPSLPSSSHSHLSSTCYSKPLISIILGVALTKPGLIHACPPSAIGTSLLSSRKFRILPVTLFSEGCEFLESLYLLAIRSGSTSVFCPH